MASDAKQTLRGKDDLSFIMLFRNPRRTVQEPGITLETVLVFDDDGPRSDLITAADVPLTLSDLFNHAHLRESIIQIAQEEARRIYAFEIANSLIKAIEDAFFVPSRLVMKKRTKT